MSEPNEPATRAGGAEPPSATPVPPVDPHRHWDGQRWLRWNGTAWVPEVPVASGWPPAHPGGPVTAATPGGWVGRHVVALGVAGGILAMILVAALGLFLAWHFGDPAWTPTSSATGTASAASPAPRSASACATPSASGPPVPATPGDVTADYGGRGAKTITLPSSLRYATELVTATHTGKAHFLVITIGPDGKDNGLLIHGVGAYSGTVLLSWLSIPRSTSGLKITADGAWTLRIRPLLTAPRWDVGAPLTGAGDAVYLVAGANRAGTGTVTITHRGRSNVIVYLWCAGSGEQPVVNEIGAYQGRHVLPGDALLIVVEADGTWSISRD